MALIDSALAGNDGFQLLERIKSLRPDADIILTASMPDVDEAVEAIRRGAIDYMTHPVAVERLLACIEHLDGRSMRASADQSTRAARAHGWRRTGPMTSRRASTRRPCVSK